MPAGTSTDVSTRPATTSLRNQLRWYTRNVARPGRLCSHRLCGAVCATDASVVIRLIQLLLRKTGPMSSGRISKRWKNESCKGERIRVPLEDNIRKVNGVFVSSCSVRGALHE